YDVDKHQTPSWYVNKPKEIEEQESTLSSVSEQKVSEEISDCLLNQTPISDVSPTNKPESVI
ncbi:4807_t:CDS:2, partial [Funneliformis geosporum]